MQSYNLPILRVLKGDYTYCVFLLLAAIILFICLIPQNPKLSQTLILITMLITLMVIIHVS